MIRAMKFVSKCADKLAVITSGLSLQVASQVAKQRAAGSVGYRPRTRQRRSWQMGLISLTIILSPLAIRPSSAAERITFSLGATIERSISLEAIEAYVTEGRVTPELAPYLSYIDPAMLVQVRGLLSQRADIDVTTVAQFAYTPQGEFLLAQAGEVFRTGARLPGGKGLSAAP